MTNGEVTHKDIVEFYAFCQYATDQQLFNIIQKETIAGRLAYAQIAQFMLDQRALNL